MNRYKHECSLWTRVFGMIFGLVAVVVLIIFVAFNFFMNNYINTNAAEQLAVYTNHNKGDGTANWLDMTKQPTSKVGVQAEAFVINNIYDILHVYNENDVQDCELIADYLVYQNIKPNEISNMNIRFEGKTFYLSVVPDEKHENSYLVFFADITTISEFSNIINTILIVVILIADLLSFGLAVIISHSVTKPIEHISAFAAQIGKGHFNKITRRFSDKELANLAEAMNKSTDQFEQYDSKQKTFSRMYLTN